MSGPHLVVVEGNRRLAALKYLYDAVKGEDVPQRWKNLIKNREVSQELFNQIPYILVDFPSGYRVVSRISSRYRRQAVAFGTEGTIYHQID